jgi:hypothetical protein
MSTAVAHELKSGQQEPESWPRPGLHLASTNRQEPAVHSLDVTQGRQIGSNPYDDATQGHRSAPAPTTTPPDFSETESTGISSAPTSSARSERPQ